MNIFLNFSIIEPIDQIYSDVPKYVNLWHNTVPVVQSRMTFHTVEHDRLQHFTSILGRT